MKNQSGHKFSPAITEPFQAGRGAPRLLFDFSVMTSLLNAELSSSDILDFGAGSGWVSELLARMGLSVVAFDCHGDLDSCIKGRFNADARIDKNLIRCMDGDGHEMPFEEKSFGHILCYDTLHHMHDFQKVFLEFYRVLRNGGRAIFVEPGAGHSRSPDTIEFLASQKKNDPNWIERDIILEEIDIVAKNAGFLDGIEVYPIPHPEKLNSYSLQEWQKFMGEEGAIQSSYIKSLTKINYWDRVIFVVNKPS